jgi:hypothetical protein
MQWGWRSVLRPETGFALALFLALVVGGRKQMLADPGCFWHLRTGELVLQDGFFRGDPYGYRDYKDWFAKDWLSELTFVAAHRAGGPDGVVVLTSIVLSILFTAIFRRYLSTGVHWMLALLLTMLAVAGSSFHFFARPLIFTLAFMTWLAFLLSDVEAGRRRFRTLWYAVPAFMIWANLHPGVLAGVGSVLLVGTAWLALAFLGGPSPIRTGRHAAVCVAWMGACALAILATPFGWDYVRLSVNLVSSPLLPLLIEEHRRLSLIDAKVPDIAIVVIAVLYTGFLLAMMPQRPQGTWLLAAAWMVLAISRIRNGELFAVTTAVVVAEQLPRHPWTKRLADRPDWFSPPQIWPAPLRGWSIGVWAPAVLIAAFALFLQSADVRAPVLGKGWATLANDVSPVELLPELREYERTVPPGTPIFNDMNFGGFVIYFAPKLKVFIDDRCELYGDRGLIEYLAVNRDPTLIDEWADRWGYDLALVAADKPDKQSAFDRHLSTSREWRCLKRTENAVLYRRDRFEALDAGVSEPMILPAVEVESRP